MSIDNTLKARVQHAVIGTGDGDTSTNSTPKKGEIVFNNTLDNFRVGDGTTAYSSLSDIIHPLPIKATGTVPPTATVTEIYDETTIKEPLFYEGNNISFAKVVVGNREGLKISAGGSGTGTVTSVGVQVNDGLTTSNSNNPITGTGTIGLNSAMANGTNPGKGGLIAVRNVDNKPAYINNDQVVAVPVFYGTNMSSYIYDRTNGYNNPPTTLNECHFVNVWDILNGIILRQEVLNVLKQALGLPVQQS